MHTVYLGLGTNQGRRRQNLARAIDRIGRRVGRIVRQSSCIETEPWGFSSPHKFLNMVVRVETELSPRQVLETTLAIERELGRKAKTPPAAVAADGSPAARPTYQDRPIDIDILLYDNLVVTEPDLLIPHPHMRERDFVMIPLSEVTDGPATGQP